MLIQAFNKTSNKIGTIIALVAQAEGDLIKKICLIMAYHKISATRHRGPARSFFLDDCTIIKDLGTNTELLDFNRIISESKKVENYLKIILDPCVKTANEKFLRDSANYDNFM